MILLNGFPGWQPEHMAEAEILLKEKYGSELSIYRSEPFFLEVMPMNIDRAVRLVRNGLMRRSLAIMRITTVAPCRSSVGVRIGRRAAGRSTAAHSHPNPGQSP